MASKKQRQDKEIWDANTMPYSWIDVIYCNDIEELFQQISKNQPNNESGCPIRYMVKECSNRYVANDNKKDE